MIEENCLLEYKINANFYRPEGQRFETGGDEGRWLSLRYSKINTNFHQHLPVSEDQTVKSSKNHRLSQVKCIKKRHNFTEYEFDLPSSDKVFFFIIYFAGWRFLGGLGGGWNPSCLHSFAALFDQPTNQPRHI